MQFKRLIPRMIIPLKIYNNAMRENQFIQLRKQKLEKLHTAGIDPYPIKSQRTHKIIEVLSGKEEWATSGQRIILAEDL